MKQGAIRWVCTGASVLVLGPLAGRLVSMVKAPDGGQSLSMLGSASPVMGIAAIAGVLGLAGVAALAAARLDSARHGLFCAGLVIAWAGWRAGDVLSWVRRLRDDAGFGPLVLDGAVLTLGGGALVLATTWLAKPSGGGAAGSGTLDDETKDPAKLGVAAIAALAGTAAAAWLVARTGMPGQIFAAATLGGLGGGCIGRTAGYPASRAVVTLSVLLLATASPAIGLFGVTDVVERTMAHELPALATITPWMWLAGLLIGAPAGIAWADSMVGQQEAKSRPAERVAVKRGGGPDPSPADG